ncbi:transcriptional regulator, TetR family [Desulfofarcimen acetoxidans DSM 771]|uniref:Transcriptional regulator, TetR family n=1 Tax=Desulfofarcimen acetoxidans (strain ATCC 49208 / DSM 771 / KCTC 5769 / VKM B-1644 / 5575) TaxID=485916 RepID=C8VXF3_DESAS|nr:TetR/AcrR family transcriptional regulator [Desulfofarcimen acetoxidans]ACV64549.1 transcriptional regulator, TetR family [Desulfofarcimen acetoxidans DSM 771]
MGSGNMLPENRLERKKRETRQKIITTALDLFRRQGFNNTTMEQIAEKTDIARKTLYNHFPVKEAIVDEYMRDISSEFAKKSMKAIRDLPDTKSRLVAALDKAYQWVEENPEFAGICLGYRMKNICRGSEDENSVTGTRSIVSEIIRLGQESGEIRRDFPVTVLATQIDILRGAVVMDWLKDMSRFELRRKMVMVTDLFLNGAANRDDSE